MAAAVRTPTVNTTSAFEVCDTGVKAMPLSKGFVSTAFFEAVENGYSMVPAWLLPVCWQSASPRARQQL
jgi:hypothetical protein